MPTVHPAQLLLSLEKSSLEWQVALAPQSDPHWRLLATSYAWEFVLAPEEGRDLVELRAPRRITDADHGDFDVVIEHVMDGQVHGPWTVAADGTLCSPPFASGAELYVRIEATPLDPNLPIAIPPSAHARGGGHFHVKTSGGDGQRKDGV